MKSNKQIDGIWQIDKEVPSGETKESLPDVNSFKLDNEYLIIRLISFSYFKDKPADDIYMLKTKWENETFFYLPPLNPQWQKLAKFENGVFVMYGNGKKRYYKKILPEEILSWNKDILKNDLQLWDYSKHGININ